MVHIYKVTYIVRNVVDDFTVYYDVWGTWVVIHVLHGFLARKEFQMRITLVVDSGVSDL